MCAGNSCATRCPISPLLDPQLLATKEITSRHTVGLVRLLAFLRRHWPQTHILVRGDSHFATPEVLEVLAHRHLMDFVLPRRESGFAAPRRPPSYRRRGGCTSSGLPSRRPITHALQTAAVSMLSFPMVLTPGASHGGSSESSARSVWCRGHRSLTECAQRGASLWLWSQGGETLVSLSRWHVPLPTAESC